MTLGGLIMIREGVKYDYCFQEAIRCLKALCDQIVIMAIDGDDDTLGLCEIQEDRKTMVVSCKKEEWDLHTGKERLSYFQNVGLPFLGTDYYFLLQGDEIIHEDCFPAIREAIATGKEAFLCTRLNLWRDCETIISVPENRQPCSTQVIRLAKTNYKSVGDGESIDANADDSFLREILIFHYGFVRKKEVMKKQIIMMQEGVFNIPHDKKLDGSDVFDSELWFSGNDLAPLIYSHPKFIKEYIKTRP